MIERGQKVAGRYRWHDSAVRLFDVILGAASHLPDEHSKGQKKGRNAEAGLR